MDVHLAAVQATGCQAGDPSGQEAGVYGIDLYELDANQTPAPQADLRTENVLAEYSTVCRNWKIEHEG